MQTVRKITEWSDGLQKMDFRHSLRVGVSFASASAASFSCLGDFLQRFIRREIGFLIGSLTCLLSTLAPIRGIFFDRRWRTHNGASPTPRKRPRRVNVAFAQRSAPDYLLVLRSSAPSASRR